MHFVFSSPRQWKSSAAPRQLVASLVATATHMYVPSRNRVALFSLLQSMETCVEHWNGVSLQPRAPGEEESGSIKLLSAAQKDFDLMPASLL